MGYTEELSKSPEYVKLIRKFNKAIDFLTQHPACGGGHVFNLHDQLWYCAMEVCKRGYSHLHDGMIDLRYNAENYKKYKALFDEELKDEPEIMEFVRVSVPYKEHYGEPWKFDHVEYWGEMTFTMFMGKNFRRFHDPRYWEKCSGVEASGRSFEEMVINIAKDFKKVFGDFNSEDFLTKEEKENHKKERPFFFVKSKEHPKCSTMKNNKKYKRIDDSEINRRWVKWFAGTPYAKKNWESLCAEIISGKIDKNYNLVDGDALQEKLKGIIKDFDKKFSNVESSVYSRQRNVITAFGKVRALIK